MNVRFIVLLWIGSSLLPLYAQTGAWGVKAGLSASGQSLINVPIVSTVPGSPPEVYVSNNSVELSRTTFHTLVFYDQVLLSNVSLQAGLGYRQKGFLSEAVYQQGTGYALRDLPVQQQDNRFDYASSELSLQFRTNPKRTVGYLRLGQRLDYLLHFNSAFWGNSYGYFKKIDYNVFGSIGLEYSFKKKWLRRKMSAAEVPLYARSSALFLEIEGVPPLTSIQKTRTRDVPFVQITDGQGNVLFSQPFRMEKIVRNTSVGVTVGVRF